MLIRSVGSLAMQTPHTGALNYSEAAPKIPAAAITFEDATMIQRLTDAGETVSVHLYMEARTLPDADSANVIGEIPGREKPDEIVVMGGHIDSWDVGAGAQDDGSGIIAALEAAAIIRKLGLHPRRTLRVVFWTNEENGTAGGQAYRAMVGGKIHDHVAAIEMDGGAEKPVGFGVSPGGPALARVKDIGHLLEPIGAGTIHEGGGGTDIGPLMRDGVPGLGLDTVEQHYFDWHHTRTDTVDKIDPREFRLCTAAMAVMSYVLADMPERLGE
jgi:Zn-dependent M28 family amino/carboxypeptidase